MDARHPYRQVVAQPVHGVVGAVRGDGLDGQRRPLGELRGDEAGDERGIRVHLVVVHAPHRVTSRRLRTTGATGYIGSSVLDTLIASGHEVVAVVRRPEAAALVAERGAKARALGWHPEHTSVIDEVRAAASVA